VVEQVLEIVVLDLRFSGERFVEIDVAFEHAVQRFVLILQRGDRLVQRLPDSGLRVLERRAWLCVAVFKPLRPRILSSGTRRNEHGVAVAGSSLEHFGKTSRREMLVLLLQRLALFLKDV
jgi:hypothetical protein